MLRRSTAVLLVGALVSGCNGEPSSDTTGRSSDTAAGHASDTAAVAGAHRPALPLASGRAAEALDRKVREYLAPIVEAGRLSGNVLLGTRDSILVLRSYGLADAGAGIPNGPDTRFVIASLTKTFTSAAVLTLVASGSVGLDDPLSRFAPDFPRADEITVRHLLAHESGVGDPEPAALFDSPESPITLEALVRRIADRPFHFDPGSSERYSNSGYALLARVIEQASGQTYGEYLEDRLFQPLEMSRSGLLLTPHQVEDQAIGYMPAPPPAGSARPLATDLGFAIGSGALSSTAPDLWRWAGAVADERLYEWKSLEWPYGWGREEIGEHRGIEQTGAITGFMANLVVFPEADRFVVVLLNQEYGGWIDLARGLAAIALGEDPEPIDVPEPVALDVTLAARFVGTYVEGDQRMRVVVEEGHLWLYWADWPIGRYLEPVGAAEFAIPADRGRIRFEEPAGEGFFGALVWDFGDSSITFRRRTPE